jgi:hypothetical protein
MDTSNIRRDTGRQSLMYAILINSLLLMQFIFITIVFYRNPIPPVLDYPNHLVRICIISHGTDAFGISDFFYIDWRVASTNIGVDILALIFGAAVGCELLARICLFSAFALPVIGAIALHRVIHGAWSWWQLIFPIFIWSGTALAGFLSFQIGIGLALISATIMMLGGDFHKRPFLYTYVFFVGLIISVFHIFSGFFFGCLIGGIFLGADKFRGSGLGSAKRFIDSFIGLLVSFGIPALLLVYLAPVPPGADADLVEHEDFRPFWLVIFYKFVTILSPTLGYHTNIDLMIPLLIYIAIAKLSYLHQDRVHFGLLVTSLCLVVLSIVVPGTVAGVAFVDWRFPIMSLIAALVSVKPTANSRGKAMIISLIFLIFASTRTYLVDRAWLSQQLNLKSLERIFAYIPHSSLVLPLRHAENAFLAPAGSILALTIPVDAHYPVLLLLSRGAFVPTLFARAGMQPVRVQPVFSPMATPAGAPAPVHLLLQGVGGLRAGYWPLERFPHHMRYMSRWTDFEYVLIINADRPNLGGDALPEGLELVADEGYAKLFRIGSREQTRD